MSPALAGGFLTTPPPRKSLPYEILIRKCNEAHGELYSIMINGEGPGDRLLRFGSVVQAV